MSGSIQWSAERHPMRRVGIDTSGGLWVHAQWHPGGSTRCRQRAIETNELAVGQAGTLYVRLEWLKNELDIEIQRLAKLFEIGKAAELAGRKDIIEQAVIANAPASS